LSFPFFTDNLNFYFFNLIKFLVKFFIKAWDKVKRKRSKIIKVLNSLNSLRSQRHRDLLPVNGQRTRSNAGTRFRILRKLRPLDTPEVSFKEKK